MKCLPITGPNLWYRPPCFDTSEMTPDFSDILEQEISKVKKNLSQFPHVLNVVVVVDIVVLKFLAYAF